MTVICINSSGRPNEIPASKWIKKDQEYTVLEVMKCNAQGGMMGFKLEEIDLTGCDPYLYFAANRFRVPEEIKEKENYLVEDLLI